jgi:hypothetical protein
MAKTLMTRSVVLEGLADLMFDRYAGDNKTELSVEQKVYRMTDGKTLCLPHLNVMSFLSAQNTDSAPKRLMDKRKYKDFANAALAFISVRPAHIPLLRDGKPIEMGTIGPDGRDPLSGVYVNYAVARVAKGIPNPKVRPVLPLPWTLAFDLIILPNEEVTEEQIHNLFERGGMAVGLGTWRGVYGKFELTQWA